MCEVSLLNMFCNIGNSITPAFRKKKKKTSTIVCALVIGCGVQKNLMIRHTQIPNMCTQGYE